MVASFSLPWPRQVGASRRICLRRPVKSHPIAKTCGKCPSPDGDADGGQSWGGGIYFEAVAAQPPGEEPSGCCPDSEGGTCTPEGLCGPGLLNTSNGNVIFSLRYPSASPFEPDARLIYNSRSTESANYGFGWTSRLHRWVEEVTFQDADLHEGDGTVYSYTNHNVSTGYYTPPDGATSALKRDFTGKWTEERADGFVLVYDSAGDLNTIQNPAGGVWTNNYTGTPPKLHSVVDPSGRRTTSNSSRSLRRLPMSIRWASSMIVTSILPE